MSGPGLMENVRTALFASYFFLYSVGLLYYLHASILINIFLPAPPGTIVMTLHLLLLHRGFDKAPSSPKSSETPSQHTLVLKQDTDDRTK